MNCPYRHSAWLRILVVFGGVAMIVYLLLLTENYETQQHSAVAPAPLILTGKVAGDVSHPVHLSLWDQFGSQALTNNSLDVLIIFTRSQESRTLAAKLRSCVGSMLAARSVTSPFMGLHILTDASSLPTAKKVLRILARNQPLLQVSIYNLERLVEPLREIVAYLQPHFSYKPGAYYSDALFFLSVAIHRVLPLQRLLMLDVDTRFASDPSGLWRHFENFPPKAVMGLAHEQQPVYYHLLREFRLQNPSSAVGNAPNRNGNPGFNSGVLLLDLDRMRLSETYNKYLNSSAVEQLTLKYRFKGHLGDQDFFTLLSFEEPELVYELPCVWNRQLCQWWLKHGYADVFQEFNRCDGTVKLYHGNCNTPMPTVKSGIS